MQLLSYETSTDIPTTEVNGWFSHYDWYEYGAVLYDVGDGSQWIAFVKQEETYVVMI